MTVLIHKYASCAVIYLDKSPGSHQWPDWMVTACKSTPPSFGPLRVDLGLAVRPRVKGDRYEGCYVTVVVGEY